MDRQTRSDVYQRTIEEQNQKLEKYQTKLRDVVAAYKALQQEKFALEESLRVLSSTQTTVSSGAPQSSHQATRGSNDAASADEADLTHKNASRCMESGETQLNTEESDVESSLNVSAVSSMSEPAGASAEVVELQQKLSTLAMSFRIVNEQKSHLDTCYKTEKKKLKQDLEDAEKRYEQDVTELKQRIHALENDAEQFKNKIRSQQHEREKELADHAIVLKELQKMINDERLAKEQLENQLDDSRILLTDRANVHRNQTELYEKTISGLRQELDAAATQIKSLKEKISEPSSLLLHLQKELLDVKETERRATQLAQLRADESHSDLKQLTAQHEEHIAGLESRIAELSENIGTIERLRQQDQTVIQKLRDRLVQLDMENNALSNAARNVSSVQPSASPAASDAEPCVDASVIVDKIIHLKDQLSNATEKPVASFIDLLLTNEEKSDLHRQCTEQHEQLKDEFERYKLRAQSILKNKAANSSKDQASEREIAALKSQVSELRDRVVSMRLSADEQETKLREKEESFTRAVAALRESHRAELAEHDAVHRARVAELESDMRRHRDRTVSMLAERDREVAALRLQVATECLMTSSPPPSSSCRSPSEGIDVGEVGASSVEGGVVSELVLNVGGSESSKILHFANERSRYETELAGLRRQKHSLEMALRECKRDAALAAQLHTEECRKLQEAVAKRDRDRLRENANLEYLKNVVHRYMMCCGGPSARQQMLNAISTILQFSPVEKQQVQDHIAKGWWVAAKPT